MKRHLFGIVFVCLFGLAVLMTGCQPKPDSKTETAAAAASEELVISAASSLKGVLTAIESAYEQSNPQVHLSFNFGGSGVLAQQIEQGAGVDVFISASNKLMQGLEAQSLLLEGSYQTLLENKLVLVIPADAPYELASVESLKNKEIKSIAVGEVKTVPAGQYALEALEQLGLMDSLKDKLIYGKDVKEVLTWVETGNADAGLVYLTDAMASESVIIASEIPENVHSPIVYPIGIIKATAHQDSAEDFIKFLNSSQAKAIFQQYGFETK